MSKCNKCKTEVTKNNNYCLDCAEEIGLIGQADGGEGYDRQAEYDGL